MSTSRMKRIECTPEQLESLKLVWQKKKEVGPLQEARVSDERRMSGLAAAPPAQLLLPRTD